MKPLAPWLFWRVLRSINKTLPVDQLARARSHLIPPGNPGAGILHGSDNVAKTCTYRATYVPGGFNRERDARRAARHTVVTDGVF